MGPEIKKGPRVVEHPCPRETRITPCHLAAVVLFVEAYVKKIIELEWRCPCPRPERCHGVGVSGFGGVASLSAYFDEALTAIWLRRFLCPDCRAVIRLRPRGYLSPFQALVGTIRQGLSNKLARGRWDPWPAAL
ncbi:hypothetical protein DFAR_1260044 [Desulfarculales bacterium]